MKEYPLSTLYGVFKKRGDAGKRIAHSKVIGFGKVS